MYDSIHRDITIYLYSFAHSILIGEFMYKTIILNNLELTKHKKLILDDFRNRYIKAVAYTCAHLPIADTSTQLHHLTYYKIRQSYSLMSNTVQEARKDIWKLHTILEQKHYTCKFKFDNCTIRFSKKYFKYINTSRSNPCISITYSPKKRMIMPIAKDKQYQRFNSFLNEGWIFDNVSLLASGKIAVVLEKEFTKSEPSHRFVVGVDIGSSTLAAVSVYDKQTGKVVRQLYFGSDIAYRQRIYTQRRAKLRCLADKGSRQAAKSRKRLSGKQRNFNKTRSGQIAKQIINLAVEFKAYVAIERLRKLQGQKGNRNKNARRKVNIIPYNKFIEFLRSNGEMFNIPVVEVDPYNTSKWCPRCGAINKGHNSKNYALYECKKCGLVVNSDRKASLCVGVKSVLERNKSHGLTICGSIQISRTQVPVNGLTRPHDVGLNKAIA